MLHCDLVVLNLLIRSKNNNKLELYIENGTLEIIDYLKAKNINIYCASLQASVNYYTQDYSNPTAIIVGAEASGLSIDWLKNSSQNIIIPMEGEIDSMNVSVAAGILIFEVKRQRQFN